jgi:hypothetical protein
LILREAFAGEYVRNGGNASKALRKVHPTAATWPSLIVAKRASEWLATGHVQGIVAELRESMRGKDCADAKTCGKVLTKIMLGRKERAADKIAAVNALSKLMGYEAPAKSEIQLSATHGVIVLPAQGPAPVGVLPPGVT